MDIKNIHGLIEQFSDGGIGIVPSASGMKLILSVDIANPEATFDILNKVEIELIKTANEQNIVPDIKTINEVGVVIDQLRVVAVKKLKERNIDLTTIKNLPSEFRV